MQTSTIFLLMAGAAALFGAGCESPAAPVSNSDGVHVTVEAPSNSERTITIHSSSSSVSPDSVTISTSSSSDSGGIEGSGRVGSRVMKMQPFSSVDVGGMFECTLRAGREYRVKLTMDDNLLKYARITVEGTTLHAGFDRQIDFHNERPKIEITLPRLAGVELNGSAEAAMSGFSLVGTFDTTVSGTSKLSGAVNSQKIRIELSGSSQADLTGGAHTGTLIASGASSLHLGAFRINEADVTLDGASNAEIRVSDRLAYHLSGASTLQYAGHPAMTTAEVEGASSASSLP